MSNQRHYPRTPMKCRIKICHPSFGELIAQTRDLSDGGVYVKHPALLALPAGSLVTGQVQDLPFEAPILHMQVMRADGEGVGLRFCPADDERQAAAE
ncbi:PilZ domain-containing protein [Pseudomonas sp. LS44]|uniref:PilZ domain-containing protein n=1 Tax=Pseudomonas sp. LS44 TaxID=1357074 RepID=UPI00215A857A|nr:PilZ domain-containing protein [Pseudomonas sp. LS44]UVE17832.1 PilZ domain-containing protein [Pseudomonas sp. LS44]